MNEYYIRMRSALVADMWHGFHGNSAVCLFYLFTSAVLWWEKVKSVQNKNIVTINCGTKTFSCSRWGCGGQVRSFVICSPITLLDAASRVIFLTVKNNCLADNYPSTAWEECQVGILTWIGSTIISDAVFVSTYIWRGHGLSKINLGRLLRHLCVFWEVLTSKNMPKWLEDKMTSVGLFHVYVSK